MKKIAVLLFILYNLTGYTQKEASNWYFGNNAGIRFNTDGTVSELTNGKLNTTEGCTTISDANGNLLFYTDGVTVRNKNHSIMPNGNGLFGDPSSTQSAIVIPKPEDPNIYYIFTVDTSVYEDDPNYGFNYSIVDISLNGGLGDVTLKNQNLLPYSSEKVTAVVKDCNTQSIWVITFAPTITNSVKIYDTFFAYEVSISGLNTTPIPSKFTTNIEDSRGYLKLSPNGEKLVCSNASSGLFIYDFNKTTGKVSNQTAININFSLNRLKPQYSYGVEFSQNNKLLYVSTYYETPWEENNNISAHYGALLQYDLTAPNISNSEVVIDDRQGYRGALQLAPNGKIYRAMNATYNLGLPYLSVINAPNNIGTACNYTYNGFSLSKNSRQGLPPFITSFFSEKIDIINNNTNIFSTSLSLCDQDTYTLTSPNISGASYIWKRNDVVLPESDFDLIVSKDGLYEVFITPNSGECDKNLEGQAKVTFHPNPIAYNYTLIQCDEDDINGGFTRFNLNEANIFLTGNIEGLSVKFYTDISRTDEIINTNSHIYDADNPKSIYVKIINDKTGCFDISELTLEVSNTQINDFYATPLCDELNSEDGINMFNLEDISIEIQTLNKLTFPITYFKTYDDALLEQNKLDSNFENTEPYKQTIYARIENDNNCYGINKVILTVNKLPNIETESSSYYCINKFPEKTKINAGLLNNFPNNYTYNWSTRENTYDIEINELGIYSVTVTNANGCSKNRTITVEASNIASFENINIVDVSENNTITVLVSGEGTYQYRLLNEYNAVFAPYQESNTFNDVPAGIYTATVKDIKNNCGTVPKKVSVIGFPKVFTPNGDGFNDTWQVQGVSSMFQPNSKILIFNRFGKLIKELHPLEEGWNGLINGNKLPTDDYWFSVKLQDGRIFKNHFTLKH